MISEFSKATNEPVDLNHLDDIKYHIRKMPYGDTMAMAKAVAVSETDIDIRYTANQLWAWAHE
jgi:hypothetical protein